MQDSLTGLANRRSFDSALSREWQRAARTGRGVALVMVDVDHFKLFNDHYGHVAGDVCLQTVATAIADTVRQSTDTAARYGGEEFAIIIPDTDLIGAMRLADRLVKQINSLSVPHLGAPTGTLSVSAGVAAFIPPHGHHGAAALVEAADAALYRAKSAGRGRVASHRVDAAEIVI
jgi:diguanylate cyclase (GGDEF)-like protein